MSESDRVVKFYGMTLPQLSDSTFDVELGISILGLNIKRGEIEFVIDWGEYWDGETKDGCRWWKHASETMLDMIYNRYSLAISQHLLDLQEKIDYDNAEDNDYPDW